MTKQELQKLRDIPIEGVAERLGLRVERHKCLCPFHDDHHASLSFNLRKNTCRCFVCMNESIGTIDLVMGCLHKDFQEACRWLANENNVILTEYRAPPLAEATKSYSFDASRYERFFEHPYLSDAAKAFLFDERKIDPRVVRWCKLTSWQDRQGTNWLQIPYYDQEGRLIGFQNRNLEKGGLPRFRFPSGAQCSIYNLQVLRMLKPGEPLMITEGASDCWSALSQSHKAIAIPSATLLKPSDLNILTTLHAQLNTEFKMYPDRDEPGERLFLQLKALLPNLEHLQLPIGCKDYSEYYLQICRTTAGLGE